LKPAPSSASRCWTGIPGTGDGVGKRSNRIWADAMKVRGHVYSTSWPISHIAVSSVPLGPHGRSMERGRAVAPTGREREGFALSSGDAFAAPNRRRHSVRGKNGLRLAAAPPQLPIVENGVLVLHEVEHQRNPLIRTSTLERSTCRMTFPDTFLDH
jgi:hypothetical protein